jgi:hypothetical protein
MKPCSGEPTRGLNNVKYIWQVPVLNLVGQESPFIEDTVIANGRFKPEKVRIAPCLGVGTY